MTTLDRVATASADDLTIARNAVVKPIVAVAEEAGLHADELIPFGHTKAKVHLDVLRRLRSSRPGRYIEVTAVTPTPLGEGKTTTTIGLVQGLGRLGHRAIACIRQPSMGPTFGVKGGAAGGGRSQVVPMEDVNLHLTGDVHAVAAAHNLVAAAIDARWYHEGRLTDDALSALGLLRIDIDPDRIQWRRVVDVNDRALRNVVIGLGGPLDGRPRQTGYDIAVASELMAILALADGNDHVSALRDLRRRCGRTDIGTTRLGAPITLEDLGVAGAVTVLLREALHPTMVQTLEGQPAFVHGGPFGNIAHGNSSILADRIALGLADHVVTESGFGADMGMEKFFDIKCRVSGLQPDCVVLVATLRALKTHGDGPPVISGRPLDEVYTAENLPLLRSGIPNLQAHIAAARRFGLPVVVAVNRFTSDTAREIALVSDAAEEAGAFAALAADHWADGGDGARELAEVVAEACEQPGTLRYLYPLDAGIKEKIETIATTVYSAGAVEYTRTAERQIAGFEAAGYGRLPICMAKTPMSISHDPALKGAPSGYTIPVREVRAAVGAGFLTPVLGDLRTMPGLGARPAFMDVDIDEAGEIVGLF